jgi:hypothetical protein
MATKKATLDELRHVIAVQGRGRSRVWASSRVSIRATATNASESFSAATAHAMSARRAYCLWRAGGGLASGAVAGADRSEPGVCGPMISCSTAAPTSSS